MSDKENTDHVRAIYNAFNKKDIGAVLDGFAPDGEIHFHGSERIPYAGLWHGRHKLQEFFYLLSNSIDIEEFAPVEFFTRGERVVVLGHDRSTVRITGKDLITEWVHVWSVRNGKALSLKDYRDTNVLDEAFTHD